jgi:valyl-tRNA synthetase
MLNNKRFVANAPQKVIDTNRQALADATDKMAKVEGELEGFLL